jgi:hypothetical protein
MICEEMYSSPSLPTRPQAKSIKSTKPAIYTGFIVSSRSVDSVGSALYLLLAYKAIIRGGQHKKKAHRGERRAQKNWECQIVEIEFIKFVYERWLLTSRGGAEVQR